MLIEHLLPARHRALFTDTGSELLNQLCTDAGFIDQPWVIQSETVVFDVKISGPLV